MSLQLEDDAVKEEDIEMIRQVKNPTKSRIVDEVLIVFKTIAVRDSVARLAPNLAKADSIGGVRPGIRLEIPRHLMPTFKMLERHGHQLRSRHGADLKRHIKFDDSARDLILDVKLPGEEEWLKLTPEVVRQLKKENYNRQIARHRPRLSASGEYRAQPARGGTRSWGGLRPRIHSAPNASAANATPIGPAINDPRNLNLPTSDSLSRQRNPRKSWGSDVES